MNELNLTYNDLLLLRGLLGQAAKKAHEYGQLFDYNTKVQETFARDEERAQALLNKVEKLLEVAHYV